MIYIDNINMYCAEDISNIENYESAINDIEKCWVCHHKLETHTSSGERRKVDISKGELIALGMYYSRPAEELIFMTKCEHIKLHNENRKWGKGGHKQTEETKKKLSLIKKGKLSAKKGKKYIFYKCVETGEVGTINDWNKRKYYHVNYGKSKGYTFIKEVIK